MVQQLEQLKHECLNDRGCNEKWKEFLALLHHCLFVTANHKKYSLLPHEVDDCIQDTMIVTVEKIEQIQLVLGYSQAVLKNKFIELTNQKVRRATLAEKLQEEEGPVDLLHNRSKEMDEDLIDQLKVVIKSLPSPNNWLVESFIFDKISHKSVAKKLNVPVNQVGVLKQRAIKKLRKVLAEDHKTLYQNLAEVLGRDVDIIKSDGRIRSD